MPEMAGNELQNITLFGVKELSDIAIGIQGQVSNHAKV